MPYIKKTDRERIEKLTGLCRNDNLIEELSARLETEGELNYTITRILHECIKNWGESYAVYNELIGALECAKLELYRKKITPYENQKIEQNGDV